MAFTYLQLEWGRRSEAVLPALQSPQGVRCALTDLAEGLDSHHRPVWPLLPRHVGSTPPASAGGLGGFAAHGWCPGRAGCRSSSFSPLLPVERSSQSGPARYRGFRDDTPDLPVCMFGDQPLGPEESPHALRTFYILVPNLPSRLKPQMYPTCKETQA